MWPVWAWAPGPAAIYELEKREGTGMWNQGEDKMSTVQGRSMCGIVDGDHRIWS